MDLKNEFKALIDKRLNEYLTKNNMNKAKEITRLEIYKGVFNYKINFSGYGYKDSYTQFIGFFPTKEMFNEFMKKATEFLVEFNASEPFGLYCDIDFSAYQLDLIHQLEFEHLGDLHKLGVGEKHIKEQARIISDIRDIIQSFHHIKNHLNRL